ncbi:MAG: RsmB/NOP family class I SAM-dependent RNA methyltransferase [Paracoccaceae bacterium]
MTPAARISAAIEILDRIRDGDAAERVLTHWARANRYAGSGDRAAIRDHVFDAVRCRRSFAWRGGADSGRGLMIGALRAAGVDPGTMFTGEKYAPAPLSEAERLAPRIEDAPRGVRLDCPDWLLPHFDESLGAQTDAVLAALQSRAPAFLRVNARLSTPADVIAELSQLGVAARGHALSPTALEVTENPRRVQTSAAYSEGRVELQDAASQAVMDLIPIRNDVKILDYCAGGGGKSLALAARADVRITAHDANPQRMRDLPDRAARAGIGIVLAEGRSDLEPGGYDLVLCDVPCSGSGAWRRSPEAKWTLTAERLAELGQTQSAILEEALEFVAPGGTLAYATCSMLTCENRGLIDRLLARHPDWSLTLERRLTPLDGGDGFYIALLTRASIQY